MIVFVSAATMALLLAIGVPILTAESQTVDNNSSYLAYNDTAYGISIKYPSNWEVDESSYRYILSLFENLSSTQFQNDLQNSHIISKVSEALPSFGLERTSDVLALSNDRKKEFIQFTSKALNEGDFQVVTIIRPIGVHSYINGSLNIISGNISSLSPISLSDYVDGSIDALKMANPDITIEEPPKETAINGVPAMTFVHSGKNPLHEAHIYKFLTAILLKGETAYVLNFASPPQSFASLLPTFNNMLNTFRIIS